MFIAGLGALLFGLLIGWISYRVLRLSAVTNLLSAIAIIIAIVGGATVIILLKNDIVFGWFAIGLVVGFFAYFGIGFSLYGRQELQLWQTPPAAAPIQAAAPTQATAPPIPPDANPPAVDDAGTEV